VEVGDCMARPQQRSGVDYFPLEIDMDQDDKITIIEAQHGIVAFGIMIKLLMKIYSEGYYCYWTKREQILFSKRVNVNINEINAIINDCAEWGLFDKNLLKTFQILTSKGIQKRYFEITKRRQSVEVIKEFLLLDNANINEHTNILMRTYVDIKAKNVDINAHIEGVDVDISKQSKSNNNNIYCAFFEKHWGLYPEKKGKGKISLSKKKELYKLGDELERCINRYVKHVEEQRNSGFQDLKYQNGSTFFNSGYIDYLDENYKGNSGKSEENKKGEFVPKFVHFDL